MHCVNIRQLKNNPSEALRAAAKDGSVLVLKGDTPEALVVHLEPAGIAEDADLRLAFATALFKAGSLSLGRAARVAQRPISELISHLSRLGIPIAEGDETTAGSDLEALDAWLVSS